VNRRDLLAALAAFGASAAVRPAQPQPSSRLPRLGFLSIGPPSTLEQWNKARFALKLRQLGWVEGKTFVAERAYGDGLADRLPALAADLVQKRVDVLLAAGPEAAVEAARATTTIPIVFWAVSFPVEQGLIDSYARPGRNVTGVAWNAGASMFAKLLEIVRRFSPRAFQVAQFDFSGALRTVAGAQFADAYREQYDVAKSLGMELRNYPVARREDFAAAFQAILASGAQALITLTTWTSFMERQRILDFVSRNHLIDFYDTKQFVEAGGLASYGPDNFSLWERAAAYVDRVLRGARPAELPVEQPTRFEFSVNARIARARGLTIPPDILLRADRVVE
jgi:putative ABC transport system substrate-binding protein